jgi:dihydroorotate dehydrogenase electron transfer subunit
MSQVRDQFVAEVAASVPLCREHWRLVLRVKGFPKTEPGQFVQVACRDLAINYSEEHERDWPADRPPRFEHAELGDRLALLRRPFSLAGRRDTPAGVELDLIHRVVGIGTQWLSDLKPGDPVHLIGPLGNRFILPHEKHGDDGVGILVGGGVGIPPMIYLASQLAGRKAVAFSGAVTRDLLPLTITNAAPPPGPESVEPLYNVEDFAAFGVPAVLSTDDGSYGFRGFITQALERYLDRFFITPDARRRTILYTCGPEPMMKRVADIAQTRGIECQVAVERAMACGMGTCQSCVIRVKKPDPAKPPMEGKAWCYRLACTDGPVFASTDLLW